MKARVFNFLGWMMCVFLFSCNDAINNRDASAEKEGEVKKDDKFSEHVRTTAFQTPQQEQQGFELPPGFKISLYASEPDIGKPINMEFDAAGRLWVSQSSEYPMAAAPDSGHDRITILEDLNGDGKADKFTHFADDLNIPIGLTPVAGGAIGFSIPNIYRFTDKNGDGTYDSKKILLGPFGHQDTHGMISNLIRGFDGWIHSCHGFTNTSTVAGTDGDSITMVSGNTFRFKEDGSRIEQTTFGRVNPFGFAFDEWGYLYSVDCHSKPIYQMINGAEYPHFGKKSPSIGFAPEMMSYELGSTALCGLVYYLGNGFPAKYQNSFYNGDVVTCRINRNTMSQDGSSPVSKRQEDFLTSSDPWFRPVDIKLGPDGAMYVADFYNRIIGHYEVPLNHPGRDHRSGRIWKITYEGEKEAPVPPKDWSKASMEELLGNLNYPQLNIRMLIANQLIDRFGQKAVTPLLQITKGQPQNNKSYVQSLWLLYRLKALPSVLLDNALMSTDPLVQTHALRILNELGTINPKEHDLALRALYNENPNVKRMAAQVLAKFTETGNLKLLLSLYDSTGEKDTHLKYTTLVSIRQNLRNAKVMHDVVSTKWTEDQLEVLIKVIPDVPLPEAASYALDYLQTHRLPDEQLFTTLEYVGRYVSSNRLNQAIAFIRNQFAGKEDMQYQLYQTVRKGIAQQGSTVSDDLKNWGLDLAGNFLQGDQLNVSANWWNTIIERGWQPENPWTIVNKEVIERVSAFPLLWSEYDWDPTGKVQSPVFKLPATLSMKVYDSEIFKNETKTGTSKNVVRIRIDKTNKLAGEYRFTSKNETTEKDKIRPVRFDLSKYQGQMGYIEVLDSSRNGGIGIGEIQPAVVSLPEKGPGEIAVRQVRAAEIIGDYKITALAPAMLKLFLTSRADQKARASAASALMSISPEKYAPLVIEVFNQLGVTPELRQELANALAKSPTPLVLATLRKGMIGASQKLQAAIAGVLIKSPAGINLLLDATKSGDADASLLEDVSIRERLFANSSSQQRKQLEQLMQGQNSREDREKIVAARIESFDSSTVTAGAGQQVFKQNCSMCHQIKGNGSLVGPQLDGIGNWGLQSLASKILNPNKSISEAFRVYNLTLKNDQALSGLYRREEGQVLIFANLSGQEFSVAKSDIKERVASKYTLMPDQFRNTLAKKDFDALLKYLLNTKE